MPASLAHVPPHRPENQQDLVLISANPKAGAKSGASPLNQLCQALEQQGFELIRISQIEQLAPGIEAAYQTGRLRTVIAAGGDGTVALVTNHTPPGVPISIFPLGTENLLGKYLELTADPLTAAHLVRHGQAIQLDAGRAGDRIFLLMAGCGFDANVIHQLHASRTGHIRHSSYFKPIWQSIRSYEYPKIRIKFPDLDIEAATGAQEQGGQPFSASWVFLFNLPRYAFGLPLAPDADGRDGLLDLCTFEHGSLGQGLRYLSGLFAGDCGSWDDCQRKRIRKIRLESDQPVPVQLDGDPAGFLPLDIEILPLRLTVLASPEWAAKNGFPKTPELR
ncbi:MAG: diacylglycerol kinase family protein [Pirellulaceae bacterium]